MNLKILFCTALSVLLLAGACDNSPPEKCGDGFVNAAVGEQCDDGNTSDGDGCNAMCKAEYCGNGLVESTEACDDGNNLSADGCSGDCRSDETCGNGIRDAQLGEACDDGNTVDGDGCSALCGLPSCGDGVQDPGEACDDGNMTSGDGCNASCTSDETCGNTIVDVGETCDDGNLDSGDGCSDICGAEFCGNGVVDVDEVCDDGNTLDGDGCSATCISNETCGNGIVDPGETCEDGNTLDGDGCNSTCNLENISGYVHNFPAGTITTTSPQCVDWNLFRATLTGTFQTVIIRGSNDPVGVTCSNQAAATQLCNALGTGTTVLGVACSGRTWNVGPCGSGTEINAQASGVCQCTNPGYTIRPCIANNNWGGINTATCVGPTQIMELICQR